MTDERLLHARTTGGIIRAFYATYDELGPWLPEYIYSAALERDLRRIGHRIGREVGVPVRFRGEFLGQLRLDMIVDECVVVEIKATEVLHPSALRQLRAYLSVTNLEVGLLLHYGPEPAFHRIVQTNDWRRYRGSHSQ